MSTSAFITPVFNLAGASTTGDIVTWNNTSGTLLADSGKLATSIVTGPGSAVNNDLVLFNGTSGTLVKDSGVALSSVVTGPATTAVNDVAVWNNTTGSLLADSSLSVSSSAGTTTVQTTSTNPTLIVTVPRQTAGAGNNATHQAGAAQSGGTNLAGGDLFLASGITTGTGRSNVRIQTPAGALTGTTDNAEIDRLVVVGNLALTSGAATTIVTPTIGSGQIAGGLITYSLRVTGGTSDLQNESSMVFFSVVNKAASVTRTTTQTAPCQALTAGTLSTVWSVTAAGLVQVTATTSLSTPSLNMVYEIHNQSFGAITF